MKLIYWDFSLYMSYTYLYRYIIGLSFKSIYLIKFNISLSKLTLFPVFFAGQMRQALLGQIHNKNQWVAWTAFALSSMLEIS